MTNKFSLNTNEIKTLQKSANHRVEGSFAGAHFTARIILPKYKESVCSYYQVSKDTLSTTFEDFGVHIAFSEPTAIQIYSDDFTMLNGPRELIRMFGLLTFENAFVTQEQYKSVQKNIFPSLAFHVDRGRHFDDQFSVFQRSPFDPEHAEARKSGTLIIPNQVAQLQASKEGKGDISDIYTVELFKDDFIPLVVKERVMAIHRWDAPTGTGELCMFDNRTVLHASYYDGEKGYRIAVRYVA